MARDTARSLRRRGIAAHYPLICAAGYTGLLAWHGGLSGSAPLKSTTITELNDTFGETAVAALNLGEGIDLSRTVASPMNLVISGVLLVGVPVLLLMLAPRDPRDMRTIDAYNVPETRDARHDRDPSPSIPDRLHESRILAWLLALPLLAAIGRYVSVSGLGRLGPNEINAAMLGLGLLLHGSLRSYTATAQEGARACTGIILQFPLYAGILGMLAASGLIEATATWFTEIGNATTVPLMTFVSAGVVNLFVPSGGGQWGIQGLVALEAGQAAGVEPGKMIMAVAYGDQLTNMLQPFWALPLLGITGVRARDIVGYTAIVMVVAGAWMAAGLVFL
jgi:short-chain fatty acids transporter